MAWMSARASAHSPPDMVPPSSAGSCRTPKRLRLLYGRFSRIGRVGSLPCPKVLPCTRRNCASCSGGRQPLVCLTCHALPSATVCPPLLPVCQRATTRSSLPLCALLTCLGANVLQAPGLLAVQWPTGAGAEARDAAAQPGHVPDAGACLREPRLGRRSGHRLGRRRRRRPLHARRATIRCVVRLTWPHSKALCRLTTTLPGRPRSQLTRPAAPLPQDPWARTRTRGTETASGRGTGTGSAFEG